MRVIPSVERLVLSCIEPEERYGRWSEEQSCSIKTVRHDEDGDAEPEDAYLIVDGSDTAHVLAVGYDEGDSFGMATGKLAIIHVFGDRKRAEEALRRYEASEPGSTFTFEDDLGRAITMSDPAGCDAVSSRRNETTLTSLPIDNIARTREKTTR